MFRSAWYQRLLALTLTLLLLLPTLPAGAETILRYGVVDHTSYVNLRSQPTQNSTRLGYYQPGVWMEITGESGNWYAVNGPDGKSGWMSKNFIAVSSDQVRTVGIVNNPNPRSYLNLRQSPSYHAKVLDYYYNGVPCTLLGLSNGWYKVMVDGQVGYFRAEFLRQASWIASDQVATIRTPNNSGLNLRVGPGKQYASLKQYRGGTYVMVLQKGTDWWRVSVDGYVGFMSASFLKDGIIKPALGGSGGSTVGGGSSGSGGYAVVTNPKANQVLNLRETASTASRVVAQCGNGTRLTVLAQGMEWCKVRVDRTGAEGYMMTDYLTLHDLPAYPTMTVSHPQKSFVNLRTSPGMSGNRVLARMPHGATVTVLVPGDSWVKVRYNGSTGYAVEYFLK